jgi:hypothetical protein
MATLVGSSPPAYASTCEPLARALIYLPVALSNVSLGLVHTATFSLQLPSTLCRPTPHLHRRVVSAPAPYVMDITSSSSTAPFAVVLPIASNAAGIARGLDLLSSLFRWEPDIRWCVVLEDCLHSTGLSQLRWIPQTCEAVSLVNRRWRQGDPLKGGLTTRLLEAFAWVRNYTDAQFLLRIDSDALVIAPFTMSVCAFAANRQDAGIIGTMGLSCNEALRAKEDMRSESRLVKCRTLIPEEYPALGQTFPRYVIPGVGEMTADQFSAFNAVRNHIDAAICDGYTTSEFCQGGAYVVTRSMLERMALAGYFRAPEAWLLLPFSEDRVMAMYARAVRLRMYDCSRPGEPFGLNFMGLAYPLETLVARQHSVIHSVKGDRRYSEAAIRSFFSRRASMHSQ